jgi:hypothetical protein
LFRICGRLRAGIAQDQGGLKASPLSYVCDQDLLTLKNTFRPCGRSINEQLTALQKKGPTPHFAGKDWHEGTSHRRFGRDLDGLHML